MKIPSFFVSPPALASEPLADGLWQCLEATGAAVTLKDSGSGTYLRASVSASELLGWSRADGVGLTDGELVDSGTAIALRAADAHVLHVLQAFVREVEPDLEHAHDGRAGRPRDGHGVADVVAVAV